MTAARTSRAPLPGEDAMYRALTARDRRFDGQFVFGVTSTGIFCRPSCPARTPLRRNVRYFARPAAAEAAGFRACRRCRPDADPGSRHWDHDRDLAERALQLLQSGCVDEAGVAGLARRLSVSERHLHRVLVAELGVGPLALARSRRAQTAQLLLQQTDLPVSEVAHAAGFASIRQFNDVVRSELGSTPTEVRRGGTAADRPAAAGPLVLRLATREPWDATGTLAFLRDRVLPGVEEATPDGGLRRAVRVTSGVATVHVRALDAALRVELRLPELAALPEVVGVVRRWFDLDADSRAVDDALGVGAALRPLVRARPGVRVPGAVDGFELAVRAVVGQQVSVAAACTLLGRMVQRCRDAGGPASSGEEGAAPLAAFPAAASVAEADLAGVGLTTRRAATVRELAGRAAAGDLDLRPGADATEQRRALLGVPGVGAWTAEYVAMRALHDPDAFPASDLVLRRRLAEMGADPRSWRPWRAYAAMHLWLAEPAQPRRARGAQAAAAAPAASSGPSGRTSP